MFATIRPSHPGRVGSSSSSSSTISARGRPAPAMTTADGVLSALGQDDANDPSYALDILRTYVRSKRERGRSLEQVNFKLAILERRMPYLSQAPAFVSVRQEYGLRASFVITRLMTRLDRERAEEALVARVTRRSSADALDVELEIVPPPPYAPQPPSYECALCAVTVEGLPPGIRDRRKCSQPGRSAGH
ncbi:uncharacterized protein LOC62_05G007643 [Vanrija pseudolonga]|uniref:Uncharacterized protein n=1 Tax=Vanrija pseudolonga TaxID=143232 RepID=A0AAF0YDV4_9TREE|nr:hypothetical protein LOC62_05G007643 [Vanrija pseudolonga]